MLKSLLAFLSLGATGGDPVVFGFNQPQGYQQIGNVALATAQKIAQATRQVTNPTGPNVQTITVPSRYARIQCSGGTVRWRDDGTAPTASVGMIINDQMAAGAGGGGVLDYYGDIANIQFILSTGTPILDISLYA